MIAPLVTESVETLAEAIRAVTDLWDEPLDEVHDIPQIVNALVASGAVRVAGEVWGEALREAAVRIQAGPSCGVRGRGHDGCYVADALAALGEEARDA